MAFTINLYRYAKPVNSTGNPSSAAYTFNDCIMREGCSVLQPVVGINGTGGAAWDPSTLSMAGIPALHRLYRITDFEWAEGLWWLHLDVDALASWRGDIRSYTAYVIRSSYSYDGDIQDTLYPVKTTKLARNFPINKLWTIGGPATDGATENSGLYVVKVASAQGVNNYLLTKNQLATFLAYVYSDNFYDAVLSDLSITMYPEAKIAIDPLQYILSIRFIPAQWGNTGWAIHYLPAAQSGMYIANIAIPCSYVGTLLTADDTSVTHLSSMWVLESGNMRHPYADDRGDYLNSAPFTAVEMFYPPFGTVPLDANAIADAEQLWAHLYIDPLAGQATLSVTVLQPSPSGTTVAQEIARLTAPIGIEIPLSHVQVAGYSPLSAAQDVMGAVGGVVTGALTGGLTGGIAGALLGAAAGLINPASDAIGNYASANTPHLSTRSGLGSLSSLFGNPRLHFIFHYPTDDDPDNNGRPLMRTVQLSTIPGFIICDSTRFSCAATLPEIETIRQAMREGFYLA